MTEQETGRILSTICEMYPSFRKERNPAATARIWSVLFRNVPYKMVEKALMHFIATDTKGFPPVPGALNEIIRSRMLPDEMPDIEAWRLTLRAISRSTYYSGEEYKKLPPAVREVVGSPENLHIWAAMDERQVQNSVAPWFMRAYNRRMEREHGSGILRIT